MIIPPQHTSPRISKELHEAGFFLASGTVLINMSVSLCLEFLLSNHEYRVDFIHRVEFEEVSGHRVLIKRGPGNRGPSECGTTHEATSGMSS